LQTILNGSSPEKGANDGSAGFSEKHDLGRGGLALVFAATTLLSLIAAAKAADAPFAFHAYLSAAASAAAVFLVVNAYFNRDGALPPAEIDGRPNYSYGAIKFATVASVCGASPASWSARGRPWSSPGRRSISTCRGRASAASGRCTPPR
jgi:hypothetical protein